MADTILNPDNTGIARLFDEFLEKLGYKLEAQFTAKHEVNPIHKPVGNTLTVPAVAPASIVVEINTVPAAGRTWYISRLAILGTDGHTAVAGAVADVYAGPGQEVDPQSQIYSGLTIPTIIEEGRFHNPMHQNDHIYAIVYGAPANQVLTLVALVNDYPTEAVEAMGV